MAILEIRKREENLENLKNVANFGEDEEITQPPKEQGEDMGNLQGK